MAEAKHWKNYWQHIQLFVDYYCVKIVKINIRFFPSILSGFRRLRLYECGMKTVPFLILLSEIWLFFFCWLFHYLAIFTARKRAVLCDDLIGKPGWNERANKQTSCWCLYFFLDCSFIHSFVYFEGYLRTWANLKTHLLMDYSNQVLQLDMPMKNKRQWYFFYSAKVFAWHTKQSRHTTSLHSSNRRSIGNRWRYGLHSSS